MKFRGDERGAAIQIGAVILFAFIVIAMASYQATVVPDQNSGVEFNHNQDVQSQMVDLTNGIDASARDGTRGSHAVRLGTTYPSRTLFVNPGSPGGQLRTVESGQIELDITVDDEDNVQTFWNNADPITTNRLQYEPNYNEYRNAPTTVFEHGELINDNPQGSPTPLVAGDIVDDGELSLVTLRGEVQSASSSTVSVDRRSLSSSGNTVTVTDGTITLPIRSDADRYQNYWQQRLAGQDGITNVVTNGATVQFDIDGELDLRMAEVGIGGVSQGGPADRAAYLYQVNTATVEVRDRFNNPVSGVTVQVDGEDRTSGEDGRVSVGADRVGDEIDWSIDGSADEEKTLTTTVKSGDVGTGGGGSGTSTYDIAWADPQPDSNVEPGENADFEVEQDAGRTDFLASTTPDDITGADVDFFYRDRDGTGVTINDQQSDSEFENGEATVAMDNFNELGEFDLFVASGGHEKKISVEVVDEPVDGLAVDITSTNSPVERGNDLDVTVSIENTGDTTEDQTIEFDFGDDGTVDATYSTQLDPGQTDENTFQYDTTNDQSGDYDVLVSSEDDTDRETATIESSEGIVTGTVTDQNDESVEDATVTVKETGQEAKTDANGEYTIENVESGDKTITADKTDFSSELKTVDVPPQGDEVVVDFRLSSQVGDVTGTVTESDGSAIEGATVTVRETEQFAQTNADGEYTLEDVAQGEQDIIAEQDGFVPQTETVTVTAGDTVTQDYSLDSRTVSGVVKDAGTDEPIEGATVTIDDADGGEETTTTESDGSYEFDFVESGEYELIVTAEGYETSTKSLTIESAGGSVTENFALSAEPGSLDGQVTDPETGDSIEDATVRIEGTGQEATTNANGEYVFDTVDRGTYDVTADHPDYVSETVEVTIGPGEDVTENFALDPVPSQIIASDANPGNNNKLTAEFDARTDGDQDYNFVIELDQSGNTDTREVTITGGSVDTNLRLTEDSFDAIQTADGVELLNPNTYADPSAAEEDDLQIVSETIDETTTIEFVQGGDDIRVVTG